MAHRADERGIRLEFRLSTPGTVGWRSGEESHDPIDRSVLSAIEARVPRGELRAAIG